MVTMLHEEYVNYSIIIIYISVSNHHIVPLNLHNAVHQLYLSKMKEKICKINREEERAVHYSHFNLKCSNMENTQN